MLNEPRPQTIDEYIASFPEHVQTLMRQLRATIRTAAPRATEKISYRMAAFDADGPLVYFAGFRNHIGFYPVPREHPDFADDLAAFTGGKGTAQFPLDRPLPLDLIRRIVRFRMAANRQRAAERRKKRRKRSK